MPHARCHDIQFWYDPISPYAYLAFERLPEVLLGLSHRVVYRPVLFAGLLKALGQLGPAEVPGKREWTYRQVLWLAHQQGTALAMPAAHPFNPLSLLRLGLATATDDEPGQTSRYVTECLFHHVWRGGADPVAPERLAALREVLQAHMAERGVPWPDTDWPESDTVKQRLRQNTEAALARGVFGVPTLEVNGRLFWGQDALPMLRDCLDGGAWFDTDAWDVAANVGANPALRRRL